MYETLSNQVAHGADSFRFMEEAMKFGQVTVSNTSDSVDILSSVINAYGRKAEDAQRISSTLFRIIDLGRVTAKDMANTLGQTTPIAAQLGISLEQLGAMWEVLTNQGVKFANASTTKR